jgi:ABC-type transporter Mla MlaB component
MTLSRPPAEPGTVIIVLQGPIDRAGIRELCTRVRIHLESGDVELVICDVAAIVRPDAATVDALARLQLTAGRLGRRIRLRHACGELRDLLGLMGLDEVLPVPAEAGPAEPGA